MTWNTETSHLKRWGSRHSWGICPAQSTRIAAKLSCSHCLWLLFSSLLVIHQTLSSGHSVFFLTLSYPLSSFYLSWACCFPLRPVPSHPPFQTQASCIWGLLVSLLLVSGLLLCSLFLFFFGDLPFFCLCLLFCFEIMKKKKRRFPCNSGVFQQGCSYSWYRQRVSGNSKDVLLVSPPPPPRSFFQNHSQFVIFSGFSLLSSISTLFFLFRFFGLIIFVAPFLPSFLLRSFQPVSCHPLLQSTLLSF